MPVIQKSIFRGISVQLILEDFGPLTFVAVCPLIAEGVEELPKWAFWSVF